MVRVFASELSSCRVKKLIFGILLSISGVIIFIVFPLLWILRTPIPKTARDFVYEYILNRENYTYQDYKNAFYGQYQYVYPLYEHINKPIFDQIRNNYQIQEFRVSSIAYDKKDRTWLVHGYLTRCISNDADISKGIYQCGFKQKTYRVKELKGLFMVLNSRNG